MKSKRPQDLVFTLYGEYLVRYESVWVGSLIALLRPFDLSEGAVRTVLSRMVHKRWLSARREGRRSYYRLTERGTRLLDEGAARIFHHPHDEPWDRNWYLLSYSIPEDVRHLRDRLRIRLAWLGFGPLGNGMWIAPRDVSKGISSLADEMGIDEHLLLFRARSMGNVSDIDLVRRCWDVDGLANRYRSFIAGWAPVLDRYLAHPGGKKGEGDERSFVLRFKLIHEFRRFPLDDPCLPQALLPEGWPGSGGCVSVRSPTRHPRGDGGAIRTECAQRLQPVVCHDAFSNEVHSPPSVRGRPDRRGYALRLRVRRR